MNDWAATAALADALGIGLLAVDSADQVLGANSAADQLLEFRPGSLVGRSTIEAFVDHRIEALIAATREGAPGRAEYVVQSKPSPTLEVTCLPGEAGGVTVALRDISELLRLRRIR